MFGPALLATAGVLPVSHRAVPSPFAATATVFAKSVAPAFYRKLDRRLKQTKRPINEGGQIFTSLDTQLGRIAAIAQQVSSKNA
jgi:hypothetical protein